MIFHVHSKRCKNVLESLSEQQNLTRLKVRYVQFLKSNMIFLNNVVLLWVIALAIFMFCSKVLYLPARLPTISGSPSYLILLVPNLLASETNEPSARLKNVNVKRENAIIRNDKYDSSIKFDVFFRIIMIKNDITDQFQDGITRKSYDTTSWNYFHSSSMIFLEQHVSVVQVYRK